MTASFNLAIEPWLVATKASGGTSLYNLPDLIKESPQLREIIDPIPTVEFGLYRLVSAVVADLAVEKDRYWISDTLSMGSLNPDLVDAYFQRWYDRFDLFDKLHPFLQTPGMEDAPGKPLAGLLPIIPSGTNSLHFHREPESNFAVSPRVAAGLLAMIAPFMTAGGAGLSPSINGAPPWYTLLTGRSLFETILLNIDFLPRRGNFGKPAWRTEARQATYDAAPPLLAGLTWQPRQIRLIPGNTGECSITGESSPCLVSQMKFKAGAATDTRWDDPAVAYKIFEDNRTPLRPQEDREVWRDTGPLALLQEADYTGKDAKVRFVRPRLVTQFSELHSISETASVDSLFISLYGMRTDLKMKVFEYRKEVLSLPAPLVWNDRFHITIQEEVDVAGHVDYELKRGIKMAYPREGKGNKSALDGLCVYTLRQFWRELKLPYDEFLSRLAGLGRDAGADETQRVIGEWRTALSAVAINLFDNAVGQFDETDAALERQVRARRYFYGRIATILNPSGGGAPEKKSKVRQNDHKGAKV